MSAEQHHDYHLVNPSPWPLVAAISTLVLFTGLALTFHGKAAGYFLLPAGLLGVLFCMYVWWRDVVREGVVDHAHTKIVQKGLRIGMALFITSEVMFFFGFFLVVLQSSARTGASI